MNQPHRSEALFFRIIKICLRSDVTTSVCLDPLRTQNTKPYKLYTHVSVGKLILNSMSDLTSEAVLEL